MLLLATPVRDCGLPAPACPATLLERLRRSGVVSSSPHAVTSATAANRTSFTLPGRATVHSCQASINLREPPSVRASCVAPPLVATPNWTLMDPKSKDNF
ncbi:NAD(P)H dehydrogenase C1 [Striga asiatica]|uniref:NAD(P)H dehydrogenase C1 n=1 Tax=Striga asiatica TaxID=4170 RepID=A0A5A7Q6P2_STRAF|nr:NAD(P)H dehydrogenase C1 [Striga asiatica]